MGVFVWRSSVIMGDDVIEGFQGEEQDFSGKAKFDRESVKRQVRRYSL